MLASDVRRGPARAGEVTPPTLDDIRTRQTTHEAVCEERYGEIIKRLERIEHVIMAATGALILTMAGALVTLLLHVKL